MIKDAVESLFKKILENRLIFGVLSNRKNKQVEGITKISFQYMLIKNRPMYQISEHYQKKVIHRNLSAEECVQEIRKGLLETFRQGLFCTEENDYHILVNKNKQMTILEKAPTHRQKLVAHNRKKKYVLEEGDPIPFLIELGVMTPEGKVIAKKYDKFRQINRFLEMVRDILPYLPKGRCLEIIDFGCGKAYLTFALYHYLRNLEEFEINIIGLDLKQDVIDHCQALACRLSYDKLKFAVGDINRHEPAGKVDLVISLHACDTATDAAMEKAVRWNADVILCVPCCQHELYGQVQSDAFASLLRHGILKERFAALATDAARAELLTILGYDVQILEFIDMEHTPKNLLIRAVKDSSMSKRQIAKARYGCFKKSLKINPSLEKRFQKEINNPGS